MRVTAVKKAEIFGGSGAPSDVCKLPIELAAGFAVRLVNCWGVTAPGPKKGPSKLMIIGSSSLPKKATGRRGNSLLLTTQRGEYGSGIS